MSEPDTQPRRGGRPTESAKAAQAFADYVSLGPKRSLRALATLYAEQTLYKSTTSALASLNVWSSKHRWQDRIAEAVSERAMQMLSEAAELDAETFLATSRQYHRRILAPNADKMGLGSIHAIRDQVKRPASQSPNLTVNVTIMNEAQRLAAELGISADELLADAEKIAAAAWSDD